MRWYEIVAALKYQSYCVQDSWEQTRLIAFILAQINSKERLEMHDIIKFPWDDKEKDEEAKPMTDNDFNRLSNKAEELINKGLI